MMTDDELKSAAEARGLGGIANTALLVRALTHKSAVPNRPLESNERLEFLGDAVLGQIVNEHLFHTHADRQEGDLTRGKAKIVCKTELAAAARRINLGELLHLGHAEDASGGRDRAGVLADAYEAVVAVLYLENGYEAARKFILETLAPAIEAVGSLSDWRDSKTILQEILQGQRKPAPVYGMVEQIGPAHDRAFTVQVKIKGKVVGSGSGRTKQAAELEAAAQAVRELQKKP